MQKDFYDLAHLTIAAVRITEHRNTAAPGIKDICDMLSISVEEGNRICRKLAGMGVIEIIEGAFGERLYITDHLKIEDILKQDKPESLQAAVEKFQTERKGIVNKVESAQAEQKGRKKKMYSDLELALKKQLNK